ncbi:MAG: S1/P1 nuclease [Nitrospinota bacterium]|nr:S1/P1 nuclease [Nitrospinota bacterium]
MRNRVVLYVIGIVLLSAIPLQEGLAWGPAGHRTVGIIAEMNLDPQVLKTIRKKFSINHLANVANWADAIKRSDDKPDVLHYTNIAVGYRTYNQKRDCPRKRCVTEKIKEYERILIDPGTSPNSKKEAFKFLVHLVADVHQPMHLGYEKDRGGSKIEVFFGEKPTNLHRVWDHDLIFLKGKSQLQFARQLNRAITPENKKLWSGGTPDDWSNESRTLVLDVGYRLQFSEGRKLSPGYIQEGRTIVEERLQRAGIRLAEMLNRHLKN